MLKKNLQNSILFFILVFTSITSGQQIYIGSGLGNATFDEYVNSFGENTIDDSGYSKFLTPLLDVGLRIDLYKQRIKLDVGFNYINYIINTSFYSGNIKIPIRYNLAYASFKAGINLPVAHLGRVKLQIHPYFSYDVLTAATNMYTDVFVDLYREKTLDRTLLSLHGGLKLEYEISEEISTYLGLSYGRSLKEAGKDSTNREEYSLFTKTISIGLLLKIGEN